MSAGERTPASSHARLQVGDWLVDSSTNELACQGELVRVESKVMEVLLLLARRAGQVVSREELLSTVWPGVIVGDDTLTQAVIKLRKALVDDARSPSYIETISKRGYRLVAPVLQPGESPTPPVTPEPARGGPAFRQIVVGASVVAALLAVAGYLYQTSERPPSTVAEEAADLERWPALPTVTVLPFEALASDQGETYLARGIVADLTTALARLSGLYVISASTIPARRAWAARYLVSGSVQRAGDHLKITVRLTDTESGRNLLSERYERPFRDVLAIQEEIIGRLATALAVTVTEAEQRRLARPYTRNLDAYEHFLRAQAALLTRERADNEKARELYRKAIEIDPAFARAYAGLALTHAADYRNQWTDNRAQALARAGELAKAAFEIDPELPEAYWVLGYVNVQRREHEQALAHLKRALALDRSFADAYALMGGVYTYVGQPANSVPALRAAQRLNPDAGYLYYLLLGRAFLFLGDAEQAGINLREALARNATNLEARIYLAATLSLAGDREAAQMGG
ncbi:MAG: winged helix-turn-helix domain-containing protein [Pseudomonadota bacterium]|nr:winged helix-turn-helix domain-containing protein [Pseudomonadota bacterium]